MVSFKSIFVVASLVAACNGYSHHAHKRYRIDARHFGGNESSMSIPGTGYQSTNYPVKTSIEATPTLPSTPFTPSTISPIETTTVCKASTYTYTLGNGHVITTTITHTNIYTHTVDPAPEVPETTISPQLQELENPDEPESFSSTTTSTITVFVTVTRQHPQPPNTEGFEFNTADTCTPHTVYVPETVYVTVPAETSISTVTVTATPEIPKSTVLPETTILPKATDLPAHPETSTNTKPTLTSPYHNHTNTTSTRFVTLTLVPFQ